MGIKHAHRRNIFWSTTGVATLLLLVIVSLAPFLSGSRTSAATTASSKETSTDDKKEAEKEDKIDDLQDKIEALEGEISTKRKKERTISEELEIIDKSVETIQLEMKKTGALVKQYDTDISRKDLDIKDTEKQLTKQKELLAEYLRRIDQSGQERAIILMKKGGGMEEYFSLLDGYDQMQEEVGKVLDGIKTTKDTLETEKNSLEEKRGEQNQIYLLQDDQKRTLSFEEGRKEKLLQQTQKDISLLSVEKEELRSQLNALQSLGNPINLDDAIKIAKYASGKTGVRTAFLLGVLRVESNLGQNVGGGRYKTDMNPSQHDLFKKICKDLGLDASDMPVSRRVCYNTKAKDGCGGWGGAMGPAQFMPSTWEGYKDKVAKVTGHNPPNPWDLQDALVAMGLKLSAVSGVTDHKESAERQAAAMYLAGGNWQNYSWYGDRVLYYADGFERYMDED